MGIRTTFNPLGSLRGLTRVEYLEADGASYIDTGLLTTSGFTCEAVIKSPSVNSWNPFIESTSYNDLGLQRFHAIFSNGTGNGKLLIGIGYDYSNEYGYVSTDKHKVETNLENYNCWMKIDDVTVSNFQSEKAQWGGINYENRIGIFGNANYQNPYDEIAKPGARMWYAKITISGKLMRNFVPVLKNGVGCMYDICTNKYFMNSGHETFRTGPLI
jgi:hypothetical protein